jgi:ribosome-binding protein aMBF1 (putative translation factor)
MPLKPPIEARILYFGGKNGYDSAMKNQDSEKIRKELGEKIRKAREKAKLTQAEVATAASLDVNYFARIERGIANPSYEKLHNIMKILKLDTFSIK